VDLRGDFVIIGSGIAGLRAAVSLADAGTVVILTKADPSESNTGYAQGGIAAAVGPDDSPELHAQDTMKAGDGLCDEEAVRLLVGDGARYVGELLEWGAAFDREPDGKPSLGREGAHSVRRVLHARDATGREIARVLWNRVAGNPRIRVLDDALATELVTNEGRCTGAGLSTRAASGKWSRRTRRSLLPAERGRSFERRPIQRLPPATGSPWRFAPARR
jgi:L-aspartate oxidase